MQQEKPRKTLDELERDLSKVQDALGLRGGGWRRTFKHVKSGDFYAVSSVALNEEDLQPLVAYHPLKCPGVTFVRPFKDFQAKFRPVTEVKE